MKVIKQSNTFKGSFETLSGEMVVQLIEDKSKYKVRCQITRHPKPSVVHSEHNLTELNDAIDSYALLLKLASL